MRVLGLVVLFVVGWMGGDAAAEKAKAKESAKVYNRAGEQGQVVIKVKEGQVMRIIRKEGRWYKVNFKGRTGWIPRSKVDLIEEEIARNTRRRPFVDGRSTKRGFGGQAGPDDRVGADAVEGATTKNEGGDDTENGDDEKPDKPKKPKKPVDDDDEKPKKKNAEDGDTDGEEPTTTDDTEVDEVTDERPRAKVKKKMAIYTEPDDESEESFTATTSMTLRLTGTKKGKYVEVENDEADTGFVLASNIEVSEDETGGGSRGGPSKAQIDVRGRLGVTLLQQGMRTVGTGAATGQPDNYNLKTSAATIALGGQYLRPYKKAYVIGAELAIDIAKAVPGIKVDAMNTTGITMYNVNARAMFGKDFKKKSGMMAFGRLGFRFNSYQVSNVGDLAKNTAKIPSEIIKAPTLGGALVFPRLTDKLGLRFSLDAILVAAALQQTKGLEDGDARNVKGANLGAGLTYKWKKQMDIQAAYDLNYLKFDFGTPSANRGHMGTSTGRTDIFHGVTVGIAMAL